MREIQKSKKRTRRLQGGVAVAALLLCGCPGPSEPKTSSASPRARPASAAAYGEEFGQLWKNDQAEISAYELTSKNGQKSTATLVFAATQFSRSAQAEGDPARQGGSDLVAAMKMNVLRRSGDRADMVTVFAPLGENGGLPAGVVNQVSFTTQSLVGQSWAQMTLGTADVIARIHSYSRGESQRRLEYQSGMLPADALPLVARRIAWPRLRLGQNYSVQLLSELNDTTPPEAARAMLSMGQERQTAVAPAGSFRVRVFRATGANLPARTWYVEADAPFRIVRWEFGDGERAALVSSRTGTPDR